MDKDNTDIMKHGGFPDKYNRLRCARPDAISKAFSMTAVLCPTRISKPENPA
jgi:hypothetical protein